MEDLSIPVLSVENLRAPDCQGRVTSRAKAALLWGALSFLACQVILAYVINRAYPYIREPEYGNRLVRLREQAAAAPDHPLLLILGSSRTLSGICPPSLPPWPAEAGPQPRIFNFSLLASGPLREWMTLHRLLAAGHRPDWLLLEVWPPYWPQQGFWTDEGHILLQDLRPEDLPIVTRYFNYCRREALTKLAFETLLPISGLRSNLLAQCAPFLLSPDQSFRSWRVNFWRGGEPSGWRPWLERGTEEQFQARNISAREQTKPCLEHFFISDTSDRALRETLQECRRRHIKAALIMMPEHSELRSWYTPAVHERVNAYLDRLKREFRVPIFDTRTWVADAEFHDLTHMAPAATPAFSERLGREMLLPWLVGFKTAPR